MIKQGFGAPAAGFTCWADEPYSSGVESLKELRSPATNIPCSDIRTEELTSVRGGRIGRLTGGIYCMAKFHLVDDTVARMSGCDRDNLRSFLG